MLPYSSITIIYNPNSTGNGKRLALELKSKLVKLKAPGCPELIPTKRAGHAEAIAYEVAKATNHPLIISASGDGGYNEVVNGLMRASHTGTKPVAGLLPAGNANDHFHDVHDTDMAKAILSQHEQQIDLLVLDCTKDGKPYKRYAHSYIGLGLTPQIGHELNKTKLNRANEIAIVAKTLFRLRAVRLNINGKTCSYDSLLFSNVSKMSKVLLLPKKAKINDGKFEVILFHRRNKLKLIATLLKATVKSLPASHETDSFTFQTVKSTLVQLDGEIIACDARTPVKISLEQKILNCIV